MEKGGAPQLIEIDPRSTAGIFFVPFVPFVLMVSRFVLFVPVVFKFKTRASELHWSPETLLSKKVFFSIIDLAIFKKSLARSMKIKSFRANVAIHLTSVVSSAGTSYRTKCYVDLQR